MAKIARTCEVSYSDLLKANPQVTTPSRIYPGQVLNIPQAGIPVTGRISFSAGNTAAAVQDKLDANSKRTYTLGASANQTLEVTFSGPSGATLAITGADGTKLQSASTNSTYRGVLPKTQDYTLTVATGSTSGSYTLTINIPARISFASGGTSATVNATSPANLGQYYILRAAKGQTLNISATPADKIQLIVYGVDGTVLRSGNGEGASYSGTLPSSQDYYVVVRSGSQTVDFTLKVSIPASGGSPAPNPDPSATSYTVKKGDTLYSIAVSFKTTVTVLMRANPDIKDSNSISVGQVIYLPGATITLSNGSKVYIARPGEYLSAIAQKFNVTTAQMIKANPQISNPNIIYTGQRINLP